MTGQEVRECWVRWSVIYLLFIALSLCYFYSQPTAENFKCQKCLEIGHFTYECTGKRKYVYRPSRTKEMVKRMKKEEQEKQIETL